MPNSSSWGPVQAIARSGMADIDALLGLMRWAGPTITYSFPGWDAPWSSDPGTGYGPGFSGGEPWSWDYAPLTHSDQEHFARAVQAWEAVAQLQIVQVGESRANVGDIRAAYSRGHGEAWAYLPSEAAYAGDIWVAADSWSASLHWTPGTYSFLTILHELGHAIGLAHPFEGDVVLPVSRDTVSHTVMSYSATPGHPELGLSHYPTTPMPLDIAAIQYLYGANTATRNGDDTYAYSDAETHHLAIWDAGGMDTIRYEGQRAAIIDLREGEGSTIGLPVNVLDAAERVVGQVPNIWIAQGAHIENAQGGSGDDLLMGNDLGNVLEGGGGSDTLEGGGGLDHAIFAGARSAYSVQGDGASVLVEGGPDGGDRLNGIERIAFAEGQLAMDMAGDAGEVAKLLGAVFGAAAVHNEEYAGLGLGYAATLSYAGLASLALEARLGASPPGEAIVDLLHTHLTGALPSAAAREYWVERLDQGELSPAALVMLAADSALNAANIDLVGLARSGLAFT